MSLNQLPYFDSYKNSFDECDRKLQQLALDFKGILKDLQIKPDILHHWNKLIVDWANNPEMPLYVRKSGVKYFKGSVLTHSTGRKIIPTDNGPAHWAFSMAFNGLTPLISEILNQHILKDRINVTMVKVSKDVPGVVYRCSDHFIDQPNRKGWKIAHIKPVGLKTNKKMEEINIDDLKDHFIRFMNPANMFLIPIRYSGLAEVEACLKAWKSQDPIQ